MELALALPGKETGDKISLSDETFGREYNEPLVHQSRGDLFGRGTSGHC